MNQDDAILASVPAADEDVETVEIRAEIEQTRVEMSSTIDAIQEKLSPDNLKEQTKDVVRQATIGKAEEVMRNAGDTVSEARYSTMDTIRQNPIPAALTGLGLALLWRNRSGASSQKSSGYQGRYNYYYEGQPDYSSGGYSSGGGVGDKVGQVQDKAGQVAGQAQETVGRVAGQAQDTASQAAMQAQHTAQQVASQAQYKAQQAGDQFQRTLQQSPLAVGALAAAVGVAVGLAVPETRREQQLMGGASSSLMDKAQTTAQETAQKVKRVAQEAQNTAQEEAQNQGLTSS